MPNDNDNEAVAMMMMNPIRMILARRSNPPVEHSENDIEAWIRSYTNNQLPDYQMAAWLMAVCLNPLSAAETATLTRCMVDSGETLNWDNDDDNIIDGSKERTRFPLVDKHSTGGVGDKVSIVLAPLVASFGVCKVPMMAGRGLGHTGGTIDKLESIPGFRTDWPIPDFQRIVTDVGCAINSAGPTLCPADRKLYALRDVTGTVSSLPLQTASIMCKKIAECPDSLVLDCKFGRGAFQANVADAVLLAERMIATGQANGLNPTTAFLTNMDRPLGNAVGNFLEIRECIQILRGNLRNLASTTSKDLIVLIVVQATQMLLQSGQFPSDSFDSLCEQVFAKLDSGIVEEKFHEMVAAQGGDVSFVQSPETALPADDKMIVLDYKAPTDGYITQMDALILGEISVDLGAGRSVADAPVDPWAGLQLHAPLGARVQAGNVLVTLHSSTQPRSVVQAAVARVGQALAIGNVPPNVPAIISHKVTSQDGAVPFVLPKVLENFVNQ